MAKVEIIAKLKQKNEADFKIADAKDIEMEDGSDLQSTIDNIKKNGTNIDTEKYATKEELETKANKTDLHEHSNKNVIDKIEQTDIDNWNSKANKEHTHDYNDITNAPTIPSIDGLATEEYVDTAIANAQLGGGEIDTSNFATKEDLNTKVDKKLGYSLVSDDEISRLSSIDNYDDTQIKNELNNKSDIGHTHSYNDLTDKPTIPSIEGLATESYVKNEIANAQLSSGEVDLSGYATKEELSGKADKTHTHTIADVDNLQTTLNNKANTSDLHSHSNKSILDGITSTNINNWNNKSEFSGSYNDLTDKPTIPSLDGYATETFVTNKIAEAQLSGGDIDLSGYATKDELNSKANKTDLHSHNNKTVIDTITQDKITTWDNKSDFSGDYNDLINKPTIPTKTSQLTNDSNFTTQAYVDNAIAKIDLTAYATKEDLNDKANKVHTHTIVEIDNLQTNLDNKANKTDLHSHSNKTVLDNITSTDVENWNNKSEFSGDYNDLTNKPALHSHSNKTILDNITASKVNSWDSKSDFSGSYNDLADAPSIPTKTSDLINDSNFVNSSDLNKKADKTELHSHINKTILDNISSDDINNWNSKTSFDGNYNSLTNKPTIPTKTSDLTNDSNFVNTTQLNTKVDKKTGYSLVADTEIKRLANVDNYDDTEIKNELNNKSDIGHTHSYNNLTDKPSIPSIEGLATETFVTNKIAEAQLSQGEIDLTGYATKDDLKTKADKTELHSHNNKIVLDGITSDKVTSWDNKSEFSGDYNDLTNKPTLHSHSNKNTLDTITDEKIAEWDSKSTFSGSYNDLTNKPTIPTKTSQLTNDSGYVTSTSLHSHTNKAVLDGITANKVSEWNNKSTFSGDYNDLTNKPTIPTVDVNKSYVDTALSKKVDKKTGYSLIADSEIERLANVDNYDDTEIKNELSKKANSSDLHSHSNKTVLDGITANKINEWNNKSTFSGNYNDLTNKPTIPTKTSQLTNDSNFATTNQLHNHSNKTVLDGITSDKIESWDNKSTFSGSYNDLTNKPTIPVVDSSLSTTSTNAIQNKAVTNALNNKANSSHNHTIANITNLQTSLNGKSDIGHTHSYNDLSDKPTIPTVDVTKSYVDAGLNKKVDKKTGYSLIADSEIERLAGVDNYDDTAIKASINTKANSSDVYTKTQTDNLLSTKANKSELHSHNNKTVLDTITEEKVTEWDNKSSFSGNYNDLINKPTIPKVDSVLSSTSTNAIQNKVVKSALDDKANISHSHTISDITNLQNSLDGKSDIGHSHSYNDLTNKPTIPTKTSQLTNDSNFATVSQLHSHDNKTVLDSITSDKVEEWNNKSIFSGDYNDLTNKPTIPVVDSVLSSTSTNAIQNKVVKNALDGKANSSHIHSYNDLTDKPTIPTVTNDLTDSLKSNYDTAYIHSQSAHAPSNAEQNVQSDWNVTDTTSDAYIKNKPTLHSHSNKAVLDGITSDKINEWNSKSDFSGDYNDLTSKPTIPIVDSVLSTTSTNAIQNKVVTDALNNKTNIGHSHEVENITGLQNKLDSKSDNTHVHDYNEIVNTPTIPNKTSQLTNDSNFINTTQLNTELNKKANVSHAHDISDINNLQDSLDSKANSNHKHDYSELNNIPVVDDALSSTSTNTIQNKVVTDALNKKANTSHTHDISNITNLQSTLNEKSNVNHTHKYNDLEDIPVIDESLSSTSTNAIQNKVVKTALDDKADKTHIHEISEITNLQTSLDNKSDITHTHNYAGSSTVGGDATNSLACSGNSATASKLQTTVNINGTLFDGSADIITSNWGTTRNVTIGNTTKSVNGSANMSWTLEEIGTSGVIEVSTVAELKSALVKGGTIHVRGGEYILGQNEELEYYSNTTLMGIGDVTIKVNPSSSDYIALKPHLDGTEGGYTGVHNVTIENITMDGQAGTNNYGLFATAHCKNIDIKNCTFKNYCGRWHLVEINSSQNVKMTNCDITDYNYNLDSTDMFCTEALQIDFAGDQGNYPFTCNLDNTGCQNITFESCNFERIKTSWTAAVGSHTITADYMPRNVTFTRCTFTDVDNCIYAPDFKNLVCDTCTAKNVANFVIMHPSANQNGTSCKIDNCEYDGWGRSKTISYMNNTAEGRFFFQLGAEYELSASKITNNTVNNAYSHGIGISPNCATIMGNSVKFSGKHGIYLYGGSQTTITGNSAVGNGTLSGYTGRDIYVSCGALGYVKRSNISNNSAYVYSSGETFEATRIQDNL